MLGERVLRSRVATHPAVVALCAVCATGCGEQTSWAWDARGSWSGDLIVSGASALSELNDVSDLDTGPSSVRIKLCELDGLSISLGLGMDPGTPAAVELHLPQGLCREGVPQVVEGAVWLWILEGTVSLARVSPDWVVRGEVTVTSYVAPGLPDLRAGETATTETATATFWLVARDPQGNEIQLDNGTLSLSVMANRFNFYP